jgi:hypothetical protein
MKKEALETKALETIDCEKSFDDYHRGNALLFLPTFQSAHTASEQPSSPSPTTMLNHLLARNFLKLFDCHFITADKCTIFPAIATVHGTFCAISV